MHGSTLQNYVYPNPRSPSIDASQETEASKVNLDRSTEEQRPNYARACMATPREKHIDASISADEYDLFEAPSDIDASPTIKASTESPIPAESKRNPRQASIKGRYIVPKAPKKVRDEAQEALTAALDQVPATIHFNQRARGLRQPFMWETWSSKHLTRTGRIHSMWNSMRFTLKTL